ncbi:GFA family protein [Streptococcus dentapri]
MEKTYQGSCHCGQVSYEVQLDFSKGTQRCNCSYCTKTRNWGIRTTSDKFTLLSGEDNLADYHGSAHKIFCKELWDKPLLLWEYTRNGRRISDG